MTYLLDVNALLALGFLQHEFHVRVASWVNGLASRGTLSWLLFPSQNLDLSGFSRTPQITHHNFAGSHALAPPEESKEPKVYFHHRRP